MLLKISLQLKLSVHQKRHLYSLLRITLTTILIQAIRIRFLDQSWLLMETSVVNPNKKRLFLEIRNKFRLRLILSKLFRSENILHRINQLSENFFLRSIIQEKFQNNFSNLKWNCFRIFFKHYPSWTG